MSLKGIPGLEQHGTPVDSRAARRSGGGNRLRTCYRPVTGTCYRISGEKLRFFGGGNRWNRFFLESCL